jgi:hypothetical protein
VALVRTAGVPISVQAGEPRVGGGAGRSMRDGKRGRWKEREETARNRFLTY